MRPDGPPGSRSVKSCTPPHGVVETANWISNTPLAAGQPAQPGCWDKQLRHSPEQHLPPTQPVGNMRPDGPPGSRSVKSCTRHTALWKHPTGLAVRHHLDESATLLHMTRCFLPKPLQLLLALLEAAVAALRPITSVFVGAWQLPACYRHHPSCSW